MLGQLKISAAANMETEMVLPKRLGVLMRISWSSESHLRIKKRVGWGGVSGSCRGGGGATHPSTSLSLRLFDGRNEARLGVLPICARCHIATQMGCGTDF